MKTKPPRFIQLLNGSWEIAPGNSEEVPTLWKSRIQVPSLVDCAEPGYDWRSHEYHWYRCLFEPATHDKYEKALLRLEQAMFGTQVFLNGQSLGGDIACYTSQEYDVSKILRRKEQNEMIIRVGNKETLPPESAVGKDQERETFIPGIWGDVSLVLTGVPRISLVQVIPSVTGSTAEVRITTENVSFEARSCRVLSSVREKFSGKLTGARREIAGTLAPGSTECLSFIHEIASAVLWSPEYPFLYEHVAEVFEGATAIDSVVTRFGMREFRVEGADFFLNGKRIFLKGGNIAFHRFLSDPERGTLPWNLEWVKKLLIDIPKWSNFNIFRSHLGQMYNRWYDIADEYGMLLQNEWQFWTTTGTKEQIRKEFTRWLQDNWNHPSIVIWDPLNESTDELVQGEIVPEMKRLDPSRPWETVDFVDDHPYIYSLGPVLNERKFGFGRSLAEIEHSSFPSVINEFLWWWVDKDGQPSSLTKEVVERWMGPSFSTEELVERQSFLAQELVELFRRMRVDAIQPFVYLSNNAGPTGHWFSGHIRDLNPKPILRTLKNAFSPFGISLELWDRHFMANETRTIRIFVFNDEPNPHRGRIECRIESTDGTGYFTASVPVNVEGSGCSIVPIDYRFPGGEGSYYVVADLVANEEQQSRATSRKIAHVFVPGMPPAGVVNIRIAAIESGAEIATFLQQSGIHFEEAEETDLSSCNAVLVGRGGLKSDRYQKLRRTIADFVDAGGTLVLLEPEWGVDDRETISILPLLDLDIERRKDPDKGGYDSYIFSDDASHPLWNGISPEHLKMFNGGFGGEVVSQHNVTPSAAHEVLARCGLKLAVIAVCETRRGSGRILVSRLQLSGRLLHHPHTDSLYARRVDPVLQRYVFNLIAYAVQRAL